MRYLKMYFLPRAIYDPFMIDRYLKPEEVAQILGVKKSTVHVWVHRRKIPYVKIAGGTLRFSEKKLREWLDGLENT